MDEIDPFALLEPKLLALFILLYETKSVTRSAEKLRQTQPNVSLWLARLRKLLGDPLFVKTHRGMEPTPRAEALVDAVRTALASLERISAQAQAFDPGRSTQTFRISMADGSHVTLLPRLLQEIRKQAPQVCLEVFPIDQHTEDRLDSGEVDMAIGITTNLRNDLYQQVFYQQDFVCLLSRVHPLANAPLSREDYLKAVHVGVSAGMSSLILEEALKEQRIDRKVVLRLPGFLGLAIMVAETDLLATVPRQIGEALARNPGIVVASCPLDIPHFPVKQFWHKRRHHDPANRWIRGVCAQILQS